MFRIRVERRRDHLLGRGVDRQPGRFMQGVNSCSGRQHVHTPNPVKTGDEVQIPPDGVLVDYSLYARHPVRNAAGAAIPAQPIPRWHIAGRFDHAGSIRDYRTPSTPFANVRSAICSQPLLADKSWTDGHQRTHRRLGTRRVRSDFPNGQRAAGLAEETLHGATVPISA
jgi:hypothetical protein